MTAIAVVLLAGCASTSAPVHTQSGAQPSVTATSPDPEPATSSSTSSTTSQVTVPSARPQAVEPTAGKGASSSAAKGGGATTAAKAPGHPQVTAPASNTTAPAKGAPTTADIRAALVSLRATEQQFRLDRVNTSGDVIDAASLPPGRWYTSIASFYGGILFGNGVACGGILHPWTLGVANKTLPCGTKVLFRYGSRAIVVKVIDRGPYVAGREWDLTAATAVALHFPGLGPVQWRIVK